MAAAPRAIAERAALEMVTSLSTPRPGPAIAVGGGWEWSPALGEAGCALVALESPRAVTWALNALGVVAASARPPLDLEAAPESVCLGLLSLVARGIGSGNGGEEEDEEEEEEENEDGNGIGNGSAGPPTPGRSNSSSKKRKSAFPPLLYPASAEPPFWVPPKKKPFCCDASAVEAGCREKDESKKQSSASSQPPWWLAPSSLAAAGDEEETAAAWACAAAAILRNAALTCAASAARLARADAVAVLCGVLEEAAAGVGAGAGAANAAANEAAADALDAFVCAAPSIQVSSDTSSDTSSSLTARQASRLAEALLSLLAPRLQLGARSVAPPPLRLRVSAARVVAALARGPEAAAAVLSGDADSSDDLNRRFAAAVAALVTSNTPAEARLSLRLDAAGACGPSEVDPKELAAAALKAAGAALHADAVSSGATALAALLTRRVTRVAAGEAATGNHRTTTLALGALAAGELVLNSPLILRALAAIACGRLPEVPRTVAGGAPTGELAEATARLAGAAADAGATCMMAAVAGKNSEVVLRALGPFASALAARAVSLPAALSSGRLGTNLNSLVGAVEAARLRVNASKG